MTITWQCWKVSEPEKGSKTVCLLFLFWICLLWWQTGMRYKFWCTILVVFSFIKHIKWWILTQTLLEIFQHRKNKSLCQVCLCKWVTKTPDRFRWPVGTYIWVIYSFPLILLPLEGRRSTFLLYQVLVATTVSSTVISPCLMPII